MTVRKAQTFQLSPLSLMKSLNQSAQSHMWYVFPMEQN